MGQDTILRLFFENPQKESHIRRIAKELRISKTAVSYHINNLIKEKMVVKSKKGVFPSFSAADTPLFRHCKIQDGVTRIMKSGLTEYLEQLNPSCIVLFGSFAKGEYDQRSDIDIFIQAKEEQLKLDKYEKSLGHKINIIFCSDLNKLSVQLYNNIINGIKLSGFIKAK